MRILRRLLGRPPAPAVAPDIEYADVVRFEREGEAPLAPGARETAGAPSLRVAFVIPWFFEGSGGHTTIANLIRGLESRGHECTLWLHDPGGRHAADTDEALGAKVRDWFGPVRGPVHRGFAAWNGADVAVATGWQTVRPVLMLERCRARAYLVQDHEPEFYATSAEWTWAEQSYRLGLHCVTAGPWLRDLMSRNFGGSATSFDLGVDHDVYREHDIARQPDSVLFYARVITPRRAVPLGMLGLAELKRRMPEARVLLFGDVRRPDASFAYEHLGVLRPDELAHAYSHNAVGMVLSLTNYSLIAQEMMACGLPAVELNGPSTRAAFGPKPPLSLADARPSAIADALEQLLQDSDLRESRRQAGLRFTRDRTWARAAEQVETGLRVALQRAGE